MHIQFPTSITVLINQWSRYTIHARSVRTSGFRSISRHWWAPRLMSFYWWVIRLPSLCKKPWNKKRKGKRKKKKKKKTSVFFIRSCTSFIAPALPPPPRSYARHYSRRFHADPRCPHGSSTVKHTVDIGETVLAINPEYRQKPGLYGGPSTSMELSATMEENGKRRFVSRVNRRFFLFSLFFFFLQRRHAILCRDSFSTDRSRNFEKWEFCWDVECNGNNAFLFFFF